MKSEPKVFIITPAYNGEAYLEEAAESVLAQDYPNWEYVILDNNSTDATPEIAARLAARDPRVRVERTPELIPAVDNHNFACGLIPDDAPYCKFVHADDTIMPDCLSKMVAAGERHPSASLIGAQGMWGERRWCDALEEDREFFSGEEIIRRTLSSCFRVCVFGCPTSWMMRSSVVRELMPLFNTRNRNHFDIEVCFRLLEHGDLAFVHQPLSFIRRHEEALSSLVALSDDTDILSQFMSFLHFGRGLFSEAEMSALRREYEHRYYWSLSRHLFRKEFFKVMEVHRKRLAEIDAALDLPRLGEYGVKRLSSYLATAPARIRGASRARASQPSA